jgi:hypothetical protein
MYRVMKTPVTGESERHWRRSYLENPDSVSKSLLAVPIGKIKRSALSGRGWNP